MNLDFYRAARYKIEDYGGTLYVTCDRFNDNERSDVELLSFPEYIADRRDFVLSWEKLEHVQTSLGELLEESPKYLFRSSVEHNQSVVCDFFNEFGLFGILFHNVRKFVFPSSEKDRKLTLNKVLGEIKYKNSKLIKTTNLRGEVSPSSYYLPPCPESSCSSLNLSWVKPADIVKAFFPTINEQDWTKLKDIKDIMVFYSEPLPLLRDVVKEILEFYKSVVGEDNIPRMTEDAVGHARVLIGEPTMTMECYTDNTYGWYQVAPSPLSAYIQNAIDYFNGHRYHRKCANERCGSHFSTDKENQKFCSDLCRKATFQRKTKKHFCFICKAPLIGGQKKYCGKEKCKHLGENYRKWSSNNGGGKFKDWPGYQEIEELLEKKEGVRGGCRDME